MDIAVVIPALEKYGGAERVAVECIRRWQHRHRITLYSAAFDQTLLREHGVDERVVCRQLKPAFVGEHAMLLNAVLLPKIWREEIGRHDVYHTHLWPTHLIDLHPMVWYPHEPLRVLHDLRFEQGVEASGGDVSRQVHVYPKRNYDRIGDVTYEATLAAIEAMDKSVRPERVVANSRYASRYLEGVYGRPVADVVYPGVDAEEFIELPTDPNFFVTIGQLWPHKRFNVLVEAIALTDEAQLVVIGSGPERERLVELARALGVEDRVFFMSGLTNRELRLILARACAFLFAPIREPFGIAVLEAMAAGLPVIAATEGGYVEVCDEQSSYMLPPYPSAFAEKMAYLLRNPDVAKAMGRAGKRIAAGYSWSRTAESLERILGEVAAAWTATHPSTRHQAASAAAALVGVQYYLWYGDGYGSVHWNDDRRQGAVQDLPLLGYYSSLRGETIEHHLDLFERMGIDFAILNLHVDETGPNQLEQVGIQRLFDIAARRNAPTRFAVQICPYGTAVDVVEAVVDMIRKQLAGREGYLRHEDRPVLFWFWSGALDADAAHVGAYARAAHGFANVAASLRLPAGADEAKLTFGMFDGMAPFSPLELAAAPQWEKVWLAAYEAAGKADLPMKVATISPGYDDRALGDANRMGNPFREIARDGGGTYRRSMAFVESLPSPPDLVMISTFNEFHESTHIEPTVAYGDLYVELTRQFVDRLKTRGET